MVWSFSQTFELKAGPCSPKHGPVPFTVLSDFFVWMFCSRLNIFKFMAGPRSSTSLVTAQLSSRRWRIVSFWCYANIQQRSNERTFVLPQTRSRAFHGVEDSFRLDGMKFFKNIRTYGWVVLPQTRPSSVHGVEDSICMDVLQPCKNIQIYGWAALPNIPCHGPTQFPALKTRFVLMLCRHSTTFKGTAGRALPNTVQSISRCWKPFSFGWYEAFQKHSNLWLGQAPPNTAQFLSRCGWNIFLWIFCSHAKTFKFMTGPRFPTSPVTAQLISRRWRIVSFWCYADIKQRSNERLVVLPQTRPSSFHGVEELCLLDGMKLFKDIQTYGWAVLPQTRPSSVHGVEDFICIDVRQPCKNTQVYGWAALPNIPCHDPAHFAALKNRFVL